LSKKPNRILIDGRTAVHTGSEGRVDAWQSYQQWGTGITMRLNQSLSEEAVNTSDSVLFNGSPAVLVGSYTSRSQGDMDTQGGVLNGGLKGAETFFRTGSSSLIIEGREAVRAFDLCEPNRGNGPWVPVIQANDAGGLESVSVPEFLQPDCSETHRRFEAKVVLTHFQEDNHYGLLEICPEGDNSARIQNLSLGGMLAEAKLRETVIQASELEEVVPGEVGSKEVGPEKAGSGEAISFGTEESRTWDCYVLEKDQAPSYTMDDVKQWPTLKDRWGSYYPIFFGKVTAKETVALNEEGQEEDLKGNQEGNLTENQKKNQRGNWKETQDLRETTGSNLKNEWIAVYPVRACKTEDSGGYQILPNGWLYLFRDGHLWREIRVLSRDRDGLACYHFSDVNLLTQQGGDRREATTQGRMDQILLPVYQDGEEQYLGAIFSESQWPWAKVLSYGGLGADRTRRQRREGEPVCAPIASERAEIRTTSFASPIIATLHRDPDSPYSEYEGPIWVCD